MMFGDSPDKEIWNIQGCKIGEFMDWAYTHKPYELLKAE